MAVLQPFRARPSGFPKPDPETPGLAKAIKPLGTKPPSATGAVRPGAVPGMQAAPGRPESNIGRYLIKPTDKSDTGYEMLNTTPQAVSQAEQQYLKQYQLPPALQPKYLRKPEVMERSRAKEISKGWIRPRSRI